MAGAGYKLFNTGDVLTAAQVNTYLMEQTVMVFADAAARTTALTGVVSEGMLSYLKSTKQVEVYNGSAWVASDDPNAIQNTIVDAKGDLITATASDVPARLAVGNNGETLVADSSATTGLRWQGNFAAGKNKIINGDFGIWQRGTTFSNPTSTAYTSDRWSIGFDGTGATRTITQQTFTPGTAPVAGYEGSTFYRYALSVAGTSNTTNDIRQPIEDVRTFAGQTVTLSFWAKADANRTIVVNLAQRFGSGGSATVITTAASNVPVTTSWTRFTSTVTVPSISGKTIGTSSDLLLYFILGNSPATFTFDLWGVQLEAGNVATAFQTATGTLAGEFAAACRYYQRYTQIGGTVQLLGNSLAHTTSATDFAFSPMANFRQVPTLVDTANIGVFHWATSTTYTSGTWTVSNGTATSALNGFIPVIRYTHGSAVFTLNAATALVTTSGAAQGFIGLSAEL